MKNKVIIITRTDAYLTEQRNFSKTGREAFGNPILDEFGNKTSYSSGKHKIKQFFKILDIFEKCGEEQFDLDVNEELANNKIDKINFPSDLQGINRKWKYAYDELISRDNLLTDEEKNTVCYVSFVKNDYDIILLLWDQLRSDEDEKIENFSLFLDCLCHDFGLENNYNNMLYIHDKQLFGAGEAIDDEILDVNRARDITKYKNEVYYNSLEKYFKYVASFAHKADRGIFHDCILKFCFGNIKASLIASEEKNVHSFKKLREESDKIIKQ